MFFVLQVQEKFEKIHPLNEWHFELRIRYLPLNLNQMYEKDKVTFYFYYDQVRQCFLRVLCWLASFLSL